MLKRKWKRKQVKRFNKPLSTEEDGKQLFLILSDDRIRGNGLQVYHKGPRLPHRWRKNSFCLWLFWNNAMGDQQGVEDISWVFKYQTEFIWLGYNVILAWRQRRAFKVSSILMIPWVSTHPICWKLPPIIGLITITQSKAREFLTWCLSTNKRLIH